MKIFHLTPTAPKVVWGSDGKPSVNGAVRLGPRDAIILAERGWIDPPKSTKGSKAKEEASDAGSDEPAEG